MTADAQPKTGPVDSGLVADDMTPNKRHVRMFHEYGKTARTRPEVSPGMMTPPGVASRSVGAMTMDIVRSIESGSG
jgi:hypothetical protein